MARSGSVTLSVELDNETTNLMGWQYDMVLPEGLSVEATKDRKGDVNNDGSVNVADVITISTLFLFLLLLTSQLLVDSRHNHRLHNPAEIFVALDSK